MRLVKYLKKAERKLNFTRISETGKWIRFTTRPLAANWPESEYRASVMQWCEKILANDRSHMIVVGILLQFIGFPVGKSKTTEKYNLVYNKNTNH